jgi:hypothetical protein
MKYFSSLKYLFIILFLSQGAIAAEIAANVAGRIIMARGDVQAITESGEIRKLKRRDSIFSHEVITTGNASRVQIRFIDNALLALKENSELNIKAYVYNEVNEKDNQVLMELVVGGFRTLTGKIGKGNKEAYKVETPVASIGIRGTLYDVQISFNKIYAGVWKGGIALNTKQGSFDLGINANFNFAEISSTGDFTGLLIPPEALTPTSEATDQDENSDSQDEKQALYEDNETLDNETLDNENQNSDAQRAEESSRRASSLGEEDDKNVPSPFEAESASDQETIQDSDSFTQDIVKDEQQEPDEIPLPVEDYTPDIRLTPAEFTQLANDPKIAFFMGEKQSVGVSLNTDGTGDNFFLSPMIQADGSSGYETIRRGGASEKDLSNIMPWSEQVNWGIWEGTNATPIQRYTRFNNDQFFEPLTRDLFYMEFSPASTIEINNGLVDGNFTYSTSTMSLAGTDQSDFIASASNGGQVTNIMAQFDLSVSARSYNINNIYLDIDVDLNNDMSTDQAWNMFSSTGEINGSNITIDTLQGNLSTLQSGQQDQATGTLTGFLLSPKAGSTLIDTFAGGFELSTVNGIEHVGGVLILQTGQVISQ